MKRLFLFFLIGIVFLQAPVTAADKLNLAAGAKGNPFYDLLIAAAEERGFWRENGLEVAYFPFRSGADMIRALAARSIEMGMTGAAPALQSAAAGVPLVIVAHLGDQDFFVYVRRGIPINQPQDLKGQRIGVPGLGGLAHAYGQVIVRALGIEKEVKFLSAGDTAAQAAAVKAGRLDVVVSSTGLIPLKVEGHVRELTSVRQFLPKDWGGQILLAHKEQVQTRSQVVARAVTALNRSANFLLDNQGWALAKIISEHRVNEETAKELYRVFVFFREARLEKKALENVVTFLVDYGIVPRERAPSVEDFFTTRFSP